MELGINSIRNATDIFQRKKATVWMIALFHSCTRLFYSNFKSSAITSELPGINKTIDTTMNKMQITNNKITALTAAETLFFMAPTIINTIPITSNRNYQDPIILPLSVHYLFFNKMV